MINKCPFCSSEDIYYSKKRQIYVCEDCDKMFSEKQTITDENQNEKNSLNLFFSYGHDKNRFLVERIKKDLEKRGHHVWIDTSEIKAGDYWRNDILQGILNASSVVAFLSEYSTRNPGVCLDELKIAVCVKGAEVKTVLLEPEDKARPPATISDIQWLDMSDWSKAENSWDIDFEKWYGEKLNELCNVLESKESMDLNGEINSLKNRLNPFLNSDKEYCLLSKNYCGRKWLEEAIEKWISVGNTKALILYGSPGSGKSSFCANYSHYNIRVLGCFFCEWNREYSINPSRLISTMAFRLAAKLPDYRSLLLRQLAADVSLDKMNAEMLFDYLLITPISNLVDGQRETGIIIVDGLDEAEKNGENLLAEVFSKYVENLPRWIRFVFTSRPERNVRKYFQFCDSLNIITDMPVEYDDIKSYIVYSLKEELNLITNKLEIINKVSELCDGIFLYAELLVSDIKNGNIKLSEVSAFPKGLNAFYQLSIRRKFPTQESFLQIRELLEFLSISNTIPEKLISGACGYNSYALIYRLDKLGAWVNRYNEKKYTLLSFSHKSLKDWFTNSELSGELYIDYKLGALKLARYCRELIRKEFRNCNTVFDKYMQEYIKNHIGAYYIESEQYNELETFLIETSSLEPYWRAWRYFPSWWNHSVLADRFWQSNDRNVFIKNLQREGYVDFLIWILNIIECKQGISNFDQELIFVYMDMVHMSGNYKKAVNIAEQYLTGKMNEAKDSEFLSMLSVRQIHHSMFYMPVKGLIDNAMELYKLLDDRFPIVYNELLFLIGGNLGVLHGNWDFCKEWLEKSESFAKAHNFTDFHKRNARKIGDYYCHYGEYEKAERVLKENISPDCVITGRYEAYLIGALANVYTCWEQNDKALEYYNILLKYTTAKGIIGWKAHSYLGIANINLKLGNINEAIDFVLRAQKIYTEIKQEWGLIMSNALLEACNCRQNYPLAKVSCSEAILQAQKMQYGSCVESIEDLCNNKVNYLKLYFL